MGVNIQKYSLRIVKESGGRYNLDKVIKQPEDARRVLVEVLELDKRAEEVFVMITLDVKNQLTGLFEVSHGGLSQSIVHPRNVFQRAILQNAQAIVLAHNHPSGVSEPSEDDISVTRKLISSGDILGIEVLDHIIVGSRDNYVSMKEKGLI